MWDKVVDIEKCHLQENPATIFETQLRNLHWIIIWYFLTLGKIRIFKNFNDSQFQSRRIYGSNSILPRK